VQRLLRDAVLLNQLERSLYALRLQTTSMFNGLRGILPLAQRVSRCDASSRNLSPQALTQGILIRINMTAE